MMKTQPLIAYKGFDKDWKCRGFQYEVGKSYKHDGNLKLCSSGFHACEYPLDIFNYYDPTGRFAEVELVGVSKETEGGDTKLCASKITIKAALTIPLLVQAAFEYTLKRCDPAKKAHATGDRSASSATGYRSASSATGYRSASSATGDSSASLTIGFFNTSEVTKANSNSVAIGIGYANKARAAAGCAIVLAHRDDKGCIVNIRASKVGENGVEPDIWYILTADGKFSEVKGKEDIR